MIRNKVVLQDFSTVANNAGTVVSTNTQVNQPITQTGYKEPVDFVTLENDGIDLSNAFRVQCFGEITQQNTDILGVISKKTISSATSSEKTIRFIFDSSLDNLFTSKGIILRFFRSGASGECVWKQLSNTASTDVTVDRTSWSLSDINDLSVTVLPTNSETVTFNAVDLIFNSTEHQNEFVKLASLDCGIEREYTEFKGDISLFYEIDPTGLDCPSSSVDFTVLTDAPPKESQTIKVYRLNSGVWELYNNSKISKVTRDANKIYTVEATGQIESLENMPKLSADTTYTNKTIAYLCSNVLNNRINPGELGNIVLTGTVKADTTMRQLLAYITSATGSIVTDYQVDKPVLVRTPVVNWGSYESEKIIIASQIKGIADRKIGEYYRGTALQYNNSTISVTNLESNIDNNRGIKVYTDTDRPLLTTTTASKQYAVTKWCTFISKDEVELTVYLSNELNIGIGDYVTIRLPYNEGTFTGVVYSMQLNLGVAKYAEIKVRKGVSTSVN